MNKKLRIDEIKVEDRFRKTFRNIDLLAESIEKIGLLHPVVVNENNMLVCGARRIRAFEYLGREEIPIRVVNIKNLVLAEHDENETREDFTLDERVAIGEAVEGELGERRGNPRLTAENPNSLNLDELEKGKRTDQAAAKIAGFGNKDTYRQAKYISEHGDDETKQKIDDRESTVNREYNRLKKEREREERKKKEKSLPKKKFNIIYADPPWQFDNAGFQQSAESVYSTMSTDEICKMDIKKEKDSVLFLWATNAMLEDALSVIKAWGFQYKTNIVWCKNKSPGMGWFVDSRHELLLIAVSGSGLHPEERPPSWFKASVSEHSKKPEVVYQFIEKMYPEQKYIELFARSSRNNWQSWGNEV